MRIQFDRRTRLIAAAVLTTAVLPLTFAEAGNLATVDVYDRSAGETLSIHRHRGRDYIEGRTGNEYAVRIRNCTGERVLAVLSVDGVNVVTGETASPDQSGYVIEPWGYVTVQGWRKSLDRTAAFYFSDPQASYANRTGRPDDLGVIGVALFRERPLPQPREWWSGDAQAAGGTETAGADARAAAKSRRAEAASEASASPMAAPSLGTGHGRNEYSPAQRVAFERASPSPDEVVALRYERRETLIALGVLPSPRRVADRRPDPFPGVPGFVPDP